MDATVVKVGGSLASNPEKLRALCATLCEASKKHAVAVVPGGGEFSDVVRRLDKRFKLSSEAAHKMAILGMDQYGLLLSDLLPECHVTNNFENAKKLLSSNGLVIFLPSNTLLEEDALESSWDVTSDSIAAYIAGRLGIRKIVLVTNVDGIYKSNPKDNPEAPLIKKLSVAELLKMNKRTSVDKFLPKLLMQFHIECFVVNGLFPERVTAVLDGENAVGTLIN